MRKNALLLLLLVSIVVLFGFLAACKAAQTPTEPVPTATSGPIPWQSERPIKEPLVATVSTTQAVTLGNLATQQMEVVIPPGTLSAGTVVTVTNPENPPPMDSSRGTPLGAPVSISAGDGPVRLNEFMTITLKFDPSKVLTTDADALSAAFYNEETRQWEWVTPDKVDLKAGTIEFTTDHLSGYGAVVVTVEEVIARKAHSQALAEITTEQVFDKMADRVVDHFLKEQLGLMEYSTKSKVYSGLLKDKEFAKIAKKFSSGDTDGAMKDLTMFTGKKLVEVVESKTLNAALVEAAKARRFGDRAYEELRNRLMEGAGETMATRTLKEMTGGGTLGEWGVDVDVASEAAGYLYEGNVREAARIMGEKVADSFLIGKIGKVGVEVIRHQISSTRDDKLNDAYQAWKTGVSGHGYNNQKGDFGEVWLEMNDALQRQVLIDARAAENEIRRAGGQPPLSEREQEVFDARVAKEMEAQWKVRAEQEEREDKIKADINKLLNENEMRRTMDLTAYFDVGMTQAQKVDSILKMRDRILLDTAGETLKNEKGEAVLLTNKDIIDLIRAHRGQANAAEAWKAYYALLKKRFGVDLTTPSPTPTAVATGKWVLVDVSQTDMGNGTSGNGTATASINYDLFWNGAMQTFARSAWRCAWPQPPTTLIPGQKWAGTISVTSIDSFRTSDELSVTGRVDYLLNPADTTFTDSAAPSVIAGLRPPDQIARGWESTTTGKQDFQWVIPQAPVQQMTITTSCVAVIGNLSGIQQSPVAEVSWVYAYELQK